MADELKTLVEEIKSKKSIPYDSELFEMISDILSGLPLREGKLQESPVQHKKLNAPKINATHENGSVANKVADNIDIDDLRTDSEVRAYLKDVYDLLYAQKNEEAHPNTKSSLKSKANQDEKSPENGERVKRSILSFPMAIIDQQLTEKQRKLSGQASGQLRSHDPPTAHSTLSNFLDVVSNPSHRTSQHMFEEDFSGTRSSGDKGWGWLSGKSKHNSETTYDQETRNVQPAAKSQRITSGNQFGMTKNNQETNRQGSETSTHQPEMRRPFKMTTAMPNHLSDVPDYELPEFRLKSPQEIYLDAKLAEETVQRNSVPQKSKLQASAPQETRTTSSSQDRQLRLSSQDRPSKNYAPQERKFKSSIDFPAEEIFGKPQSTQDKYFRGHGHRDDSCEYAPYDRISETLKQKNDMKEKLSTDFNLFSSSEDGFLEEKYSRDSKISPQERHSQSSRKGEFSSLTSQKIGHDLEALMFKNEPELDYDRKVREKSMDKILEFPNGREKMVSRFPNLMNALQTGASLNIDKLKADSRRENLIHNFLESHPQLKKNLNVNRRSDKNLEKDSREFDFSFEKGEMNKQPIRKHEPSVVFDDEFKPEDFEVLKLISDLLESTSEVKTKIKNESEEERSTFPPQRKSFMNRISATTTPAPPQLPRAVGVSYRRKESDAPKLDAPKVEAPRPETRIPMKSGFPLERVLKPMANYRPDSLEDVSIDSQERSPRWRRFLDLDMPESSGQIDEPAPLILPGSGFSYPSWDGYPNESTGSSRSKRDSVGGMQTPAEENVGLGADSWLDESCSDESSNSFAQEKRHAPKFPSLSGFPGFNGYPMDASEFSSDDSSDVSSDSLINESYEDPLTRTMYGYLQGLQNNVPTASFKNPFDNFFLKFLEMENCLISDESKCYEDTECNKNRLVRTPGGEESSSNSTDSKNDEISHSAAEPQKTPEKNNDATRYTGAHETVGTVKDGPTKEPKTEVEESLDHFISNFEGSNSGKGPESLTESSSLKSVEEGLQKITGNFDRFTFYDVDSDDFDTSLIKNLAKKDTGATLKSRLESKIRNTEAATAQEQEFTHQESTKPVDEKPEKVNLPVGSSSLRKDVTNLPTEAQQAGLSESPKLKSVETSKSKPVGTPKPKSIETPKNQPAIISSTKSTETQKSKSVETQAINLAETPGATTTNTEKPKPKTQKSPVTEAPKSIPANVEKSSSAEMRSGMMGVPKPKVVGLSTSGIFGGASDRQLQLPVSEWKENKAALMEKISTNLEVRKNVMKNLRQELGTTSGEAKTKFSSLQSLPLNASRIFPLKPVNETLAELKMKEPMLSLSAKLNKV